MLFANAAFNVFNGVFDVTNCVKCVLSDVRQNVAVDLLILYSIIRFELCLCRSVLCYAKPMLVLIRVFRELDRYGLARAIDKLIMRNLCCSQWQSLYNRVTNIRTRPIYFRNDYNRFFLIR